MDRRSLFDQRYLNGRWPSLEGRLIRDPENFHDLVGGRPYEKRVEYNERRTNWRMTVGS